MSNRDRDTSWHPLRRQKFPAAFQPTYADGAAYAEALERLAGLPPIVFRGEVEVLKSQIAEAAQGRRFILHGGDCVERFIDCNPTAITNKLKILLQMSVVLSHAARRPVVRIGRIAGQYFKPRSSETEVIDGRTVLTYRGDTVNGFAPEQRDPDPDRLVDGYFHATATLNYIRSMIDGGFADLHHPYTWNLDSIERSEKWEEYRTIVESILDAIHFMESFGGANAESLGRVEFFTSHEGLHLGYESALTRAEKDRFYNLGAHLLWIGDRTRAIDGAHVDYFRGISNPIAVKLSAHAGANEVIQLCRILNPGNEPGRLSLITRLGASSVGAALPPLVKAVQDAGAIVAWMCDPMHGNTVATASDRKTRRFTDVLSELSETYEIHESSGSTLAGVHFELTGEDVTECVGGTVNLEESDLSLNYQTYCDPRLNYAQSMEMAFLISGLLRA
ncbi:MAG: 3-deoxy-7-phosphoheptulonate synthase [Spirochaetales bacterium]|nr:3-deoxy-7-phosphoheptulonate synthase [Spirochaetales bacterium]